MVSINERIENEFDRLKLDGGHICPSLYVFETIGSTNDTLLELATDENVPGGCMVISQQQTNGHGRSGRSFFSPEGNLYFSILIRDVKLEWLPLITPASAVATARGIEKICHKSVRIKWVNDLFYNSMKVSGTVALGYNIESEEDRFVIIGTGINMRKVSGSTEADELLRYGGLFDFDEDINVAELIPALAATIYDEFMSILDNIEKREFFQEYRQRSIVIGSKVSYLYGNNREYVEVLDIDNDGGLVVRDTNGNIRTFSDGEIRIDLEENIPSS